MPRQSGIPYELGIIRNHYVGRTFIQPTQAIRDQGVRMKHSANRAVVAGKRIVLVDDFDRARHHLAQDRADDARRRRQGSAFPHRLAADHASATITASTRPSATSCWPPPTISRHAQFIGADSLAFLSVDGIYRAMGLPGRDPVRPQFTDHCFTGDYPTALTDQRRKSEPAAIVAAGGSDLSFGLTGGCLMTEEPRTARRLRSVSSHPYAKGGFAASAQAGMTKDEPCPNPSPTASRSSPAPRAASAPRVALHLAQAGAHVVAVARTVGGLEELDDKIKAAGGSATLVPLDMKDFDGIARLALALNERYGRLDVLVGNAGILRHAVAARPHRAEDWDDVFAINVTANWHLIRAFDPLLKRSDAGRAVFVTSGLPGWRGPISAPMPSSKAALDALVRTYAAECATTNVRVNLFSPGQTRTRMMATAFPGIDPKRCRQPEEVAKSDRAALPAGLHRERQALRLQGGQVLEFPAAGLTAGSGRDGPGPKPGSVHRQSDD